MGQVLRGRCFIYCLTYVLLYTSNSKAGISPVVIKTMVLGVYVVAECLWGWDEVEIFSVFSRGFANLAEEGKTTMIWVSSDGRFDEFDDSQCACCERQFSAPLQDHRLV